jgi:hypothetical protein
MPWPVPPHPDAPIEEWLEYLEEARKRDEEIRLPKKVWERILAWYARLRLLWWIRLGLFIIVCILILIAVRRCRDAQDPTIVIPTQQGKACTGSDATRNLQNVSHWSVWGCATAVNNALQLANAKCQTMSAECTGACEDGGVCSPGLAVDMIQQVTSWTWCEAHVTFSCPCSCRK